MRERRPDWLSEQDRAEARSARRDEGADFPPTTEEQRGDALQMRDVATEAKPIVALAPRHLPLLTLTLTLAAACGADLSGADGSNVGFGGAQDIGQLRDLLDRGEIPGPSTLDANGFFSEHHIELPAPDCGQPLCAHGMLSVGRSWLDGSYQAALQLALNTPVEADPLERPPLNLVVVVDRSGSMLRDDRLAYLKTGLQLLVGDLREEDRVALVAYHHDSELLLDFEASADREALRAAIDGLVAEGNTNLHAGLADGLALAAESFDPARQNRVILLSDGLANAGITDPDTIFELADAHVELGVGITTIGVGDEFDVELMRGLSERGAGNFYYLEDAAAVAEVFAEELEVAVMPLALGVALEVEIAPGYALGEAVGSRLWKTEGRVGAIYVPAVFLATRESNEPDDNGRRGGGSAVFVEALPLGDALDGAPLASVRLRYRLPGETELRTQSIEVVNPHASEAPAAGYHSHAATEKGYAVYNLFLALRRATEEAEWSYDRALAALEPALIAARTWNAERQDGDVDADIALLERFAANLRERGARPIDDDYDHHDHGHIGCATTGGGGAPWWLAAALLPLARRRR